MSERYRHLSIRHQPGDIVFHTDFSERDTMPAELIDDGPKLPAPDVRELFGEPARREFLEAVSQGKGRA